MGAPGCGPRGQWRLQLHHFRLVRARRELQRGRLSSNPRRGRDAYAGYGLLLTKKRRKWQQSRRSCRRTARAKGPSHLGLCASAGNCGAVGQYNVNIDSDVARGRAADRDGGQVATRSNGEATDECEFLLAEHSTRDVSCASHGTASPSATTTTATATLDAGDREHGQVARGVEAALPRDGRFRSADLRGLVCLTGELHRRGHLQSQRRAERPRS